MKIYVPLIYFELEDEEKEIADVIFHGYYTREDAEMLHPGVEILEVNSSDFNPQDN